MEDQEKKSELNKLYGQHAAVNIQMSAIALAGSIAGVVYSVKKGNGFWPGVGYWILGGMVIGIPARIAFANKKTSLNAQIKTLESDLKVPPLTGIQLLYNMNGVN